MLATALFNRGVEIWRGGVDYKKKPMVSNATAKVPKHTPIVKFIFCAFLAVSREFLMVSRQLLVVSREFLVVSRQIL